MKAGDIQVVRAGRRRLVYPVAGGNAFERAAGDGIMRGGTARRIAKAIHDAPGRNVQDIAVDIGESPRVVYYHVRRLIEAKLVHSASETRHRDLQPTLRLAAILQAQEEIAGDPSNPG